MEGLVDMDYKNILNSAFSQLYLQYFLYSLIFSKQATIKWSIIQAVPIVAIVSLTWIADSAGLINQFEPIDYSADLSSLMRSPVFIIRLSIISLQLIYAYVIWMISRKLIPLYQDYIERSESNTARNLVWVKKVYSLLLALSAVYTIESIYTNLIISVLYFIVAIIFFGSVIVLVLNHYTSNFNLKGDLYAKIGIRWNIRQLWYIPEYKKDQVVADTTDHKLFEQVENWIFDSNAYAKPNFSFKDIADKFPQLDYNLFDTLLRRRYTDKTFQSYIRDMRIKQAIKIMETDSCDLQLQEIANKIGFESGSSFSRAFKATTNMTPSQWRKPHPL